MSTFSRFIRLMCIGLLMVIGVASATGSVFADCQPNGTNSADTITCSGADGDGILGSGGNDSITIDNGATVTGPVFGDGIVAGNGGDDTIINNGTTIGVGATTGTNGDLEGDVVNVGNGGNDTLINNGTVAGDMDGDTVVSGNGGNDTIINNGAVEDDLDGDNAGGSGGDDIIINNGTVGGDIQGDDNTGAGGSVGGNDTITINGGVGGSVQGDAGVQTGGDDTVILQNGANGGSDNALSIDGGGGTDTLVFNFTVTAQADYDALAAQIAAALPSGGSLTFNGQTFTWTNFEQLQNLLVLVISGGGGGGPVSVSVSGSPIVFRDGRINNRDAGATAALYCVDGGVMVLGIDAQSQGQFLYTADANAIQSALAKAAASHSNLLIVTAGGQSLYALASEELSLVDAGGRYTFTFAGNTCGT